MSKIAKALLNCASELVQQALTYFIHTKQKEKGIKYELDVYNSKILELKELINEVRSKQHQYENRFATIAALPYTHHDYLSLKQALIRYSEYISADISDLAVLQINRLIVAAFLFSKLKMAQRENKLLHIIVKNPILSTSIPEEELVEILGIMIDNMLEAYKTGSKCELTLDSKNDMIIICSINEGPILTAELQQNLFTQGYSTKCNFNEGTRGYGLYNLMQIINRYEGKVYIDNEFSSDNTITYIKFCIMI